MEDVSCLALRLGLNDRGATKKEIGVCGANFAVDRAFCRARCYPEPDTPYPEIRTIQGLIKGYPELVCA